MQTNLPVYAKIAFDKAILSGDISTAVAICGKYAPKEQSGIIYDLFYTAPKEKDVLEALYADACKNGDSETAITYKALIAEA